MKTFRFTNSVADTRYFYNAKKTALSMHQLKKVGLLLSVCPLLSLNSKEFN